MLFYQVYKAKEKAFKRIGNVIPIQKVLFVLRKKIFTNILWLSFDRIFRLALSLFVGAAVARYLGPMQWGKLNYVLAFVSIALSVVTMGLDGFLIKELLENPKKKNKILGTVFILRLAAVLLSLITILLIFKFLHAQAQYYIIFFFLFLSVAVVPFDLIDIDYQLKLMSKKSIQAKSIAYIISSVIKIAAIVCKMPVVVFAAILGFESILACFLLFKKYNGTDGNVILWSYDKELIKHLSIKTWPFLLSSISVVLYMRLDQIMLGNLLSVNQVGEFTAAVKITEIFLFIPIAVTGSYYGILLRAKENFNNYVSKIMLLFNVMFFVSFSIALAVFLFSNIIVHILYGSNFIEAPAILRIHIWSLITVFLGVAANQYFVIENLQRYTFYSTFLGLVSNVALNIFFIPKWGAKGTAYATIISYSIAAIISNVIFKKSRTVFKYQLQSFLIIFKPATLYHNIKSSL